MATSFPVTGPDFFIFPLWALTPKIRMAVEEAIAVTQAPPALVASSALAAASLAVQTKFDVRRFNGLSSPCSLFMITFAESGERKTTVDRMFFGAFSEFEENIARQKKDSNNASGGESA
jgi:putative DNA primase/helicase